MIGTSTKIGHLVLMCLSPTWTLEIHQSHWKSYVMSLVTKNLILSMNTIISPGMDFSVALQVLSMHTWSCLQQMDQTFFPWLPFTLYVG